MDMVVTTPPGKHAGPLSLLLKTRGTHESFQFETNIESLVALLDGDSGLPSYAVTPLYGVRLSDQTLQKLGYFLD